MVAVDVHFDAHPYLAAGIPDDHPELTVRGTAQKDAWQTSSRPVSFLNGLSFLISAQTCIQLLPLHDSAWIPSVQLEPPSCLSCLSSTLRANPATVTLKLLQGSAICSPQPSPLRTTSAEHSEPLLTHHRPLPPATCRPRFSTSMDSLRSGVRAVGFGVEACRVWGGGRRLQRQGSRA